MTMQEIRRAVIDIYRSDSWRERVRHMPDYQVYAIYMKTVQKKQAKLAKNEATNNGEGYWKQMTLLDYISEKEKTNEPQ